MRGCNAAMSERPIRTLDTITVSEHGDAAGLAAELKYEEADRREVNMDVQAERVKVQRGWKGKAWRSGEEVAALDGDHNGGGSGAGSVHRPGD